MALLLFSVLVFLTGLGLDYYAVPLAIAGSLGMALGTLGVVVLSEGHRIETADGTMRSGGDPWRADLGQLMALVGGVLATAALVLAALGQWT